MRLSDLLRSTALAGLLLFCLLATADAQAQTGRIVGTVTDAQTGDPLPGANIVLQGTSRGTASNPEGQYTLQGVPAGNQVLLVTYIGYQQEAFDVRVVPGQTVTLNITLAWEGVVGDEVVITAQAAGQTAAINQQLASNTITNIVSRDRIQDIPDVNAAESIGRLPGVSIQRSGGEATRVAIRGLSPKYNTVTVNGVRMPSTGGDDRAVDLHLISSNMLDGVAVTKAITPDMDADAIGGSVDLRLRQAPVGLSVDVLAQGGFNQLQSHYGNYKLTGTVSNRFFNDQLGVIVTANTDGYDRSADKLFAGWEFYTLPGSESERVNIISNISGREERVDRARSGASIVTDYQIPHGQITGNAFFSRINDEGITRVNQYFDAGTRRIFYDINLFDNTTSILTASIGAEQDFGWIQYDVGFARTASRYDSPDNRNFQFAQEGDAVDQTRQREPGMELLEVIAFATPDSSFTGLAEMNYQDFRRSEDQYSMQANVQLPYRLGELINGYVKLGGKLRWLDRTNDETQYGLTGLHYGIGQGSPTVVRIACAQELLPDQYRDIDLAAAAVQYGMLPMMIFDDGYSRDNFLGGDYPLGYTADPDFLVEFSRAMDVCGIDEDDGFLEDVVASRGRDYRGEERYQSAYLMTEINIGRYVTMIPGFRWERDATKYIGQQFREVVRNNVQAAPTDLAELVSERENSFFLPMLHLRVRPTEWLQVHLARTETLSRPDFIQYVPITRISAMQDFAFAGNTDLRPSHTVNLDASVSVFERRIGLFTLSAFHKTMSDHIRWVRMFAIGNEAPAGLNIPDSWLVSNPVVDTYINNPYDATYNGFEIDWQTNFWYLPSVLKGLVLNLNYTNISSNTTYQAFDRERVCINCPVGPGERPIREFVSIENLREGRLIDQPSHIANVTVGYDIAGFSTRLSYLYQTDRTASVHGTEPAGDEFSGDYSRWDLMARQQIRAGLEVFANLNNLTATRDRSFRGSPTGDPVFEEYYGFTMDIGVRYRF